MILKQQSTPLEKRGFEYMIAFLLGELEGECYKIKRTCHLNRATVTSELNHNCELTGYRPIG